MGIESQIISNIKLDNIDSIYEFKGLWGAPSKCGLKIVNKLDRSIFIVTELYDENPGTSVASFCAQLATQLRKEHNITPEHFVFIEHVPDKGSKLENYSESFDLVMFDWDGDRFQNPEWKRLSRKEFETMIS